MYFNYNIIIILDINFIQNIIKIMMQENDDSTSKNKIYIYIEKKIMFVRLLTFRFQINQV